MQTSLSIGEQTSLLQAQLNHFFPDGRSLGDLRPMVERALLKLEYCFSRIKLKPYSEQGDARFNHLHSEQYAMFLYFVSNVAWKDYQNTEVAAKLFWLNKALNSIVCMYDTILPDIFLIVHSVGIVLGKARYANHLVVFQNVTVGSDVGIVLDRDLMPTLEENVVIYGGAVISGNCHLMKDVTVSANSFLLHETVPERSIATGRSPDLLVKPSRRSVAELFFHLS